MELSVIIVNWNSADLLRSCLESVLARSSCCDLEVLVIDNASYDGTAEMINKEFPSVTFIQSNQNLGFAGGNNRAFEKSKGENVLFLNPDAELVGDALSTMLAVLKARQDAGIVGPKLVNPDLSVQIDGMRAFPTILNQLFDSSLTRKVFGKSNFGGVKPVIEESEDPVSVEMLPGTCVMLRRELFDQVGRFNEKYFMYAEDVDLNYRVKAAGWINYYVARAAVIHYGGRSSSQQSESFFSTVMIREAVWEFLRASRSEWYAFAYRVTTCLAAVARVALLCLLRLPPVGREIRAMASHSTRKWTKVLRWTLGMEGWAHGYRPASLPPRNKRVLGG
jgi:GT2 family glycosyltransferase